MNEYNANKEGFKVGKGERVARGDVLDERKADDPKAKTEKPVKLGDLNDPSTWELL
jgi:hypothetical protein